MTYIRGQARCPICGKYGPCKLYDPSEPLPIRQADGNVQDPSEEAIEQRKAMIQLGWTAAEWEARRACKRVPYAVRAWSRSGA